MSRTAGVGLQDYAAINTLAVTSLILGAASFLVILFADAPVLLAVPLLAIVIGAIAFVQVRTSNGTQTGATLAALGVLLGVGFAGYWGVSTYSTAAANRQHAADITAVAEQLGAYLANDDYSAAYQLFDERFRQRVRPDVFESTMRLVKSGQFYGKPVVGISTRDRTIIERDRVSKDLIGDTVFAFTFDETTGGQFYRNPVETARFIYRDGQWRVLIVQGWFPVEQQVRSMGS